MIFRIPNSTPVVAPASGRLYKAAPGGDSTYGANWNTDPSFYIKQIMVMSVGFADLVKN